MSIDGIIIKSLVVVTMQNYHCVHNRLAVTVEARGARPAPTARVRPATPLGDNDGGASYRSSSVGDVTLWHGEAVHAGLTRGRLSLS